MQIDSKIFKAYDIRGVYPSQLNEENIVPIIQSIYKFFLDSMQKEQITIALGYDMRLSSPSLFEVAQKTLLAMGANVVDVGLVSTPSFYFAVYHYKYDCGIQITASHNPKEYNGVKFVKNSPEGLIKIGKSTGMDEVKDMAIAGVQLEPKMQGTLTKNYSVVEEEVTATLELFGNPELKKFKIVADPANAMGAQYIDALFKKAPAELVKMNFELDGSFPVHQPDPLDFENLKDLQAKVLEEKADFGLAPDGDGDRLFFIDEKGAVVPATMITGLICRELLKTNPGATILFDIRYILTPQKIVTELGGKYDITKVGHAFITESMGKNGAIFGGESSAHYFYKTNGNAESQLTTIIIILKILSETGKTLSQLVEEVRRSYESGEINFKVANAQEIMDGVKEKYKDGELSPLDGIAITYPDWRVSIRTSNTEPLLRLNVESYEKATMEAKRDEVIALINDLSK
ncbi:MAG TPA: phosphomannomutase/phosphoglucomutase [Candidatus Saccharimonadales bacterium]|nr:phosphomannomutase/phosphoglucomutase [Candidatus Saccharimonadales bacterium]